LQDIRIGFITRLSARNHLPWNRGLFSFSGRKGLRAVCLLMTICAALGGCFATQKTPMPGIAIILSDNSPAFVGVQREIGKKFPQRVETYTLGDESKFSAVRKKIQSSDLPVIVAIGLPAARLAQGLSDKKVIFCQVFNYEDAELVTPWMKGVSATAPVREQFRAWKALDPKLTRVGVITGKNLQGLMKEAQAAASENRIRLDHVEVSSDKETIYAYKQLVPKIEGLWLVPDNRVLSNEVIRDMMAYSVKQGKQVVVFSHEMLGLGGLVSAESSYADIADQVLVRIRQAQEYAGVPGVPVAALTKANIRINAVMASRLNLALPKALRGVAHAP
jgi:putative ABC transport system substrate-binding protein